MCMHETAQMTASGQPSPPPLETPSDGHGPAGITSPAYDVKSLAGLEKSGWERERCAGAHDRFDLPTSRPPLPSSLPA